MARRIQTLITEPFWFKLSNKARYYGLTRSDIVSVLLLQFVETTELDYLFGIKNHMKYEEKNENGN